jgi:hypothetical protein
VQEQEVPAQGHGNTLILLSMSSDSLHGVGDLFGTINNSCDGRHSFAHYVFVAYDQGLSGEIPLV